MLHRLWGAGVLNLDVTDMIPAELAAIASRVAVDAQLPPLVVPVHPADGVAGLLEIQAGEVYFSLEHPGGEDLYALTLREAIRLELTNDHIVLALDEQPRVDARVVASAGAQAALAPEALVTLTMEFVWPMVVAAIGPGLEYPIPTLPLSQVAAIAPDLEDLEFHLDVGGHGLDVRRHHIMAEGGFVGEVNRRGGGGRDAEPVPRD